MVARGRFHRGENLFAALEFRRHRSAGRNEFLKMFAPMVNVPGRSGIDGVCD